MDLDNIQQNMNTRVVFREPRGMIRWLQLFFGIIAFSTVADFYTNIGITITCPQSLTPAPPTNAPNNPSTSSTTTTTPATNTPSNPSTSSTTTTSPVAPLGQAEVRHLTLSVQYPFDFNQQAPLVNDCPSHNYTYNHVTSLNGSPQFFVMSGVLSLIYAVLSLTMYLFFSNTYDSVPIWPIADLIITGMLCLFWFIAAASFSSGVTLLKSTVLYQNLEQTLCPASFKQLPGAVCSPDEVPSWKSLNVGLVTGFTEFFLWGTGMWFVYKETTFHQPADPYGPR